MDESPKMGRGEMDPPGVVKGRLNTKQTECSLSSPVVPRRPGLPHARRKVDMGDKGRAEGMPARRAL